MMTKPIRAGLTTQKSKGWVRPMHLSGNTLLVWQTIRKDER